MTTRPAQYPHVPQPNNWGRWGDQDERGTLNLLTPEVVRRSLESVKEGRVISLSMPIRGSTSSPARSSVPHLPGRPLPQHFMSIDGGDYAAGAQAIGPGLCVSDDALIVSPHGTTTHVDALCHAWTGGQVYNGHGSNRIRSYGATRCGIDKAGGIVTRGVLLDVARYLGVEHLDGGAMIDANLLAACADDMAVDVRAGDVVMVRTGWPLVFATDRERYYHPQPGLMHDAGLWLAQRDVAVVAVDNAGIARIDADGRFIEDLDEDLHLLLLWRHGVHLLEMVWLEELSTAVAQRPGAEFLFILSALNIEGGTASPVNPLAVV